MAERRRERSLVVFTVLAPTAVGLFAFLLVVRGLAGPAGDAWIHGPLWLVGPLLLMAVTASLLHLGTPGRAWRALGNLRTSWLSREILGTMLFGAGWLVLAANHRSGVGATWWVGAVLVAGLGVAMVASMGRVYRLRTVPAWRSRWTSLAFLLTAGLSGSLAAAALLATGGGEQEVVRGLVAVGAALLVGALAVEPRLRGHLRWAADQVDPGLNPGLPRHGGGARSLLLVASLVLCGVILAGPDGSGALAVAAAVVAVAAECVGRDRFYAGHARSGL
jgi:anaerobic dimethyl sulfoxide reductase subunit C (anchor subunit)